MRCRCMRLRTVVVEAHDVAVSGLATRVVVVGRPERDLGTYPVCGRSGGRSRSAASRQAWVIRISRGASPAKLTNASPAARVRICSGSLALPGSSLRAAMVATVASGSPKHTLVCALGATASGRSPGPWVARMTASLCVPITSATWADAPRLAVGSVPRSVLTWPGVR